MKLTPRGALRAVTATVAALALSVVAAAPSLATAPVDTIVLDPTASLGPVGAWAPLDESRVGSSDENPAAFAQRIIAEVVADPASGAGTALLGEDLPASAGAVHAHFAEFVTTDAVALAASSDHALATYAAGTATLVYANDSDGAADVAIDLRSFAEPTGATVATYTTDTAGELVAGAASAVDATGIVSLSAPARAVVTVVVDGLAERPAPSAAPAAPAAVEAPASALVGKPFTAMLESGHATGKTIELGNPAAQQTTSGGATYTAPAAAFTIGRTATAVAAQALTFYPVTGLAETYVIAAPDGRVLVRRANTAADYRYLDLRESTVDAAAADPYAQWTLVDAGSGWSYVHNAQRDGSGAVAALDMYNWATADGSEVQTYSSGTAAVQRWRLHRLAPTVAPVAAVIERGTVPTLPASLRAAYSWGPRVALGQLTWQQPTADVWNVEGTVNVSGAGIGYFGEQVPVTATYTVGTLAASVDADMSTFAGAQVAEVRMRAPRTVQRAVSGSETTVTAPVSWDWNAVSDADFAAEGTVTVPSVEGLGFSATLSVTVQASEIVNILRGAGVHADYTFKDGTAFALTDGVRNVTGFADWRSGGATNRGNPNAVWFSFDEPRQITGVSVFDQGGQQNNVGAVTVQYRDLIGGWVDLPGTSWPVTNPSPELALEVETAPVVATGVRVIITNKSNNTWMSLSEVEVRGPAVSAR